MPEQRHEPNNYYKRCVIVCQIKAANQAYTLLLVHLSTVVNNGHHCCHILCQLELLLTVQFLIYIYKIWSSKQKSINSSPITGLQCTPLSISQSDSQPLNQPACTKSHSHSLPLHQPLHSLFLMIELGWNTSFLILLIENIQQFNSEQGIELADKIICNSLHIKKGSRQIQISYLDSFKFLITYFT